MVDSAHLGNVLVVVSDKKIQQCSSTVVASYVADVVSANDYSAFHAILAGRSYTAANTGYRFGGSNGQEKDDEIFKGAYTAEYWEYDSRSGRRWNVDPKGGSNESPYAVLKNNPLAFLDFKGDTPTAAEACVMQEYAYNMTNKNYTGVITNMYNKTKLIGGWSPIFQAADKSTGFNSVLFQRTKSDGLLEYSYVFAGTDDFQDVVTDLNLYTGVDVEQMNTALKNASKLSDQYSNSEFTFVGHSLGGWLAAGSSLLTGRPAVTFNAPGISTLNRSQYHLGLSSGSNIKAFMVQGEILTGSLSIFGLASTGKPIMLKADYSIVKFISIKQQAENHTISVVKDKLIESGLWDFQGKTLPNYGRPKFEISINKPDNLKIGN